jgi:hypothetical protein
MRKINLLDIFFFFGLPNIPVYHITKTAKKNLFKFFVPLIGFRDLPP